MAHGASFQGGMTEICKQSTINRHWRYTSGQGSGNLVEVKPYNNPHDREDTTLGTITPLLLEIAREGYSDIPGMLGQVIVEWDDSSDTDEYYGKGTHQLGRKFRRMTADVMAAEYQRRLDQMK
jgi:hypothetical protein